MKRLCFRYFDFIQVYKCFSERIMYMKDGQSRLITSKPKKHVPKATSCTR